MSVGVSVSSLRAPGGSPPASALPAAHRVGARGVFLAAVAAAVLLLPPGMCDRPKCSGEMSPIRGLRVANLVLCFASKLHKVLLNNDFTWSMWEGPTQVPSCVSLKPWHLQLVR